MKKIISIAVITLSALFFASCTSSPPPQPACNTANSPFSQLYASLAANSAYQDISTMDLITHEYTFTLSSNKTICSIGYQSNANISTQPYDIEIADAANNIVYSGSHVFSSSATQYVTLSTPVTLSANTSYTIRRYANNYGGNISNTVGRMVKMAGNTGPVTFPVTAGVMTITGSRFYGTGGPLADYGIPFIDIIFQ